MKQLAMLIILLWVTAVNPLQAYHGTDSIGYFIKGTDTVVIYEVGAGETLTAIARKYQVSMAAISQLNPTLAPDQLRNGQIIKIPGAAMRKRFRAEGAMQQTAAPQQVTSATGIATHTIMAGETLYAIARHYGISVAAIQAANPGLQVDKINPGQILKLPQPADKPATEVKPAVPAPNTTNNNSPTSRRDQGPTTTDLLKASDIDNSPSTATGDQPVQGSPQQGVIRHTVKKGETMFSISRQYNVTVTDLKDWNNLESFQIDIGQQLIVGYAAAKNDAAPVATQNPDQSGTSVTDKPAQPTSRFTYEGIDNILSLQYKEDLSSQYFKEERNNGIATWISDVDGYPYDNGYFALHRTLPIGTIVKVRNLMNDKIVFAKVIGRLPNTAANDKIMLKLPEAAKQELKVLDDQMVMEVSYLRKSS